MKKPTNKKINEFLLKVLLLIVGIVFLVNIIPHVANTFTDGLIKSIDHK